MSAKWIRSKQWDDQHIPSWAWPIKFLLRAFSGIPLAVVLLSLVVLYATLASVPLGLIALAPTYALYGITLMGTVAVIAVVPAAIFWRLTRGSGLGVGTRFPGVVLILLALTLGGVWAWHSLIWPALHYDPVRHTGVRLFADFIERYGSTTLRRMPGMEMSELEFYSWWPLRVILLVFVLNMVTATVRRIEFTLPYLGVITVHTGIVIIALGSMYYHTLKLEGDTLLRAGQEAAADDGTPTIGPPQAGFYDNTRVVLCARQGHGLWEQRSIRAPRYNDYNLSAGSALTAATIVGRGNPPGADSGRTLDRPVPSARPGTSHLDPDISFRIVGYASYADLVADFVQAAPPAGGPANPLRFVSLRGSPPQGAASQGSSEYAFYFLPEQPAGRISEFKDDDGQVVFALEYTRDMADQRWRDLTQELPAGTTHALVVEVPGEDGSPGFRGVYPASPGARLAIGETGYTVQVGELHPAPPFPIITEGYRGATSSLAVVRVTAPDGTPFDRWVYSRFPEINQDLLDQVNERGMPVRRNADPAIRIAYLDASVFQVFMDEREDGSVRGLARLPGGGVRTFEGVRENGVVEEIVPRRDPSREPRIDLAFGARWAHAEPFERPSVVPEARRDKADVGTHARAMLAVEVAAGKAGEYRRIVWLPFTRYLGAGLNTERDIVLPGGRVLSLAFGRRMHSFPDFFIQLADFQMIAYDHRGSPRDYQSIIRVVPAHDGSRPPRFKPYQHVTRLNEPLQAPFMPSDERGAMANLVGTLASRLSARQFKLSQAGWDAEGWRRTQQMADQGQLPRPYASFTILGVGNNPGIHVIALGAILVSVGIPWAFYIKPLIVRRRKARLQSRLAAGVPARPPLKPTLNGELSHAPDRSAQPAGVDP